MDFIAPLIHSFMLPPVGSSAYCSRSAIEHSTATGDILLFAGRGALSIAIGAATRSPWSHVGMAIWGRDFPELSLDPETLYLLESTGYNFGRNRKPDALTGAMREDVRLTPLWDRFVGYSARVMHVMHLDLERVPVEWRRERLLPFMRYVAGADYERGRLQLAEAAFKWLGPTRRDVSSLFCSELVAEAYMFMLLLEFTRTRPSNRYAPDDFAHPETLPWARMSVRGGAVPPLSHGEYYDNE